MSGLDEWMTTQEAADFLGVTQARVRQLIMAGTLIATKRGRDNWLRRADVEAWQAKRPPRGRPPKEQTKAE